MWAFERQATLEGVLIAEHVHTFDADEVDSLLSPLYTIIQLNVSPEEMGWWVSRSRSYYVLIRKSPNLNFVGIAPEFFKTFAAVKNYSCESGRADMFFAAPDEVVDEVKAVRWDKKYGMLGSPRRRDPAPQVGVPWEDVLTDRQAARKLECDKAFVEKWSQMNCMAISKPPFDSMSFWEANRSFRYS